MLNRAALSIMLLLLVSCGSGGGGGDSSDNTTRIDGRVVDGNGNPLPEVSVYIFDTNESSITDESGGFSIESYAHLSSAEIYFKRTGYTNRIQLGEIPDSAPVVTANFSINILTNDASLIDVSFSSDSEPVPTPDENPAPGETPLPGPKKTPTPKATPKPSNFDSSGNTTAFGIPRGLKGNISSGQGVWRAQCVSCHASDKTNRSYGQIKASIRVVPTMQSLTTTNQEIAHITAYLNRNRK